MFDSLNDAFDSFNDSVDDTNILRKTASLATGRRVIDADALDESFEQLELALVDSDVEREIAEHIVRETRQKVDGQKIGIRKSPSDYVRESLREVVADIFAMNQLSFDDEVADADKPVVVLVVGINGVGKTTTIAKMMHRYQEQGYSVVAANGDTFRAGAEEQIRQHTDALGVRLISHDRGGDPAAVLYDAVEYAEANNIDIVFCDTAGRLNTDTGLMNQLNKINDVVSPDYRILVEDGTAGQDAINRAHDFNEEVSGLDGVVVTKIDATETGGPVLSIPFSVDLPVLFVGTGEEYSDLEFMYPDEFAKRII